VENTNNQLGFAVLGKEVRTSQVAWLNFQRFGQRAVTASGSAVTTGTVADIEHLTLSEFVSRWRDRRGGWLSRRQLRGWLCS
jgi:hypothetical protein